MPCSACCTSSEPLSAMPQDQSCLHEGTTKISLLVIGLLLAGGVAGAYFAGWGFPGIVSFSTASSLAFILLAFSMGRQSATLLQTDELASISSELPQIPTVQEESDSTQDTELLLAFKESSIEDKADLSARHKALKNRIKTLFKEHTSEGATSMATHLRPFFDASQDDQGLLEALTLMTLRSSGHPVAFVAAVFDAIVWPTDEIKNSILSSCIAYHIKDTGCFTEYPKQIPCGDALLKTRYVVLLVGKIFGLGTPTFTPHGMPPFFADGIAYAVHLYGQQIINDHKESVANGTFDKTGPVGFILEIEQTAAFQFPAAMISPILPYLDGVPELIGLKLHTPRGHGFENKDIPVLMGLFDTNLFLVHLEVNQSAVEINNILNDRQKNIPTHEAIANYFPEYL